MENGYENLSEQISTLEEQLKTNNNQQPTHILRRIAPNAPDSSTKNMQTQTVEFYKARDVDEITHPTINGMQSPTLYRSGRPGTGDLQRKLHQRALDKTQMPKNESRSSFLSFFYNIL